jgi:hypothetical protein
LLKNEKTSRKEADMYKLILITIVFLFSIANAKSIEDNYVLPWKVAEAMSEAGYDTLKLIQNEFGSYEVNAVINGRETIRMLIIDNYPELLFSKVNLYLLDIDYFEPEGLKNIKGETQEVAIATIDSIRIGDALIKATDAYVLEFSDNPYLEHFDVEAILGREFLLKNHALIDYGNGYLYIPK